VFKRQRSGHVVNIASVAGLIHAPNMAAYNTSKAAVVALSETMLVELKRYDVGVSVVCPGFFRTRLSETVRSPVANIQVHIEQAMSRSKLTAADVAAIVYRGIMTKRFYILPHRIYRVLWLFKRLAMSWFFKVASAKTILKF
jgi:short-subunit dehydrogenase